MYLCIFKYKIYICMLNIKIYFRYYYFIINIILDNYKFIFYNLKLNKMSKSLRII